MVFIIPLPSCRRSTFHKNWATWHAWSIWMGSMHGGERMNERCLSHPSLGLAWAAGKAGFLSYTSNGDFSFRECLSQRHGSKSNGVSSISALVGFHHGYVTGGFSPWLCLQCLLSGLRVMGGSFCLGPQATVGVCPSFELFLVRNKLKFLDCHL